MGFACIALLHVSRPPVLRAESPYVLWVSLSPGSPPADGGSLSSGSLFLCCSGLAQGRRAGMLPPQCLLHMAPFLLLYSLALQGAALPSPAGTTPNLSGPPSLLRAYTTQSVSHSGHFVSPDPAHTMLASNSPLPRACSMGALAPAVTRQAQSSLGRPHSRMSWCHRWDFLWVPRKGHDSVSHTGNYRCTYEPQQPKGF